MKFVELKKHLLQKKLFAVYNLCGDDGFLLDSAKNLFFTYVINNNELSKVKLSCETLTADRLKTILSTSSFLLGERVVLIGDLNIQKNKDILDVCVEYSKRPDPITTLVVVSNEPMLDIKKDAKFLSAKDCKFCMVDCNRLDKNMMARWIASNLAENSAKMSQDAISTLIDFSNGYLSNVEMEMQKLISYANGREITKQDVELLVTKDLEYGVFELTECLGRGDAKRSLLIVDDLMKETKTAQSVLGMIQNYFRRMFYVAITPGTNLQIAEKLGVKEWAVVKAKQTASLFTKAKLKDIVEMCGDLDFQVRTGKIAYKRAVDNLILYVLTNKRSDL